MGRGGPLWPSATRMVRWIITEVANASTNSTHWAIRGADASTNSTHLAIRGADASTNSTHLAIRGADGHRGPPLQSVKASPRSRLRRSNLLNLLNPCDKKIRKKMYFYAVMLCRARPCPSFVNHRVVYKAKDQPRITLDSWLVCLGLRLFIQVYLRENLFVVQ